MAAENLCEGNAAAKPTSTIQSRKEGAASSLHSKKLPVSYEEGGGWYGKSLFEVFQILKYAAFTCFFILLYFAL